MFDFATVRVGHAQQLRKQFDRMREELVEHLGLDVNHLRVKQPLEDFLELNEDNRGNSDVVATKIERYLPSFDHAPCVSFERLKDATRLGQKMAADDRDTFDTYGIQLWLSNAQLMRAVEKLGNPQNPLRKKWEERGIIITVDDHLADSPKHGYPGIHINASCKGNKGWRENLEMQTLPVGMMHTYLITRDPYETYRALEEHVKANKGKNENNWSEEERGMILPLRHYIRALFEADTYKTNLMNKNFTPSNRPVYATEQEAREAAKELEPAATYIASMYKAYEGDVQSMFQDKNVFDGLKGVYAEKQHRRDKTAPGADTDELPGLEPTR